MCIYIYIYIYIIYIYIYIHTYAESPQCPQWRRLAPDVLEPVVLIHTKPMKSEPPTPTTAPDNQFRKYTIDEIILETPIS